VEHPEGLGCVGRQDDIDSRRGQRASGQGSAPEWLADANGGNAGAERQQRGGEHGQQPGDSGLGGLDDRGRPGPTNGFWRDADWLFCTDGKWRPVEPGTFPLVDGAAFKLGSGSSFAGKSRAKMLKGYGGAIVAPQSTAFIKAAMELMP
jgi:DNA (cytosine-5)-methyltransferase 1